tara:strand:- start:927 stop:1079 length:153 start_codon:yes stop_codon:yes gene_type:complete
MNATKRGLLIGTVAGIIVAATNWNGNLIVAASSIMFSALIGYLIGRRFER